VEPRGEPNTDRGWSAALSLRLAPRAGRTRLRSATHHGPLRVQRAFHPEPDGTAHVVLLHPPAGLVSGDRLDVDVVVEGGGRALVTTTGAGKAYRAAAGREATSSSRARVAAGSALEWVPQESVVFDGAHARLETSIELEEGGALLAWEVICLGRPACSERFTRGALWSHLAVTRGGRPLFVERGQIVGGDPALGAPWGLGGRPAFGTMLASAGGVDDLRAALDGCVAAVTRFGELRVVRAAGRDGSEVRAILERARHVVRDAWGRPRLDPGIWRS